MTRDGNAELLTRTTLQLGESAPGASLAHLVATLQRVPGVLLAEVNGTHTRAVVAHDSGVPVTSLLAAAAGAGVCATIAQTTPRPSNAAASAREVLTARAVIVAATVFLALSLVDAMIPNITGKVLTAMLAGLWAIFFAKTFFVLHRRS